MVFEFDPGCGEGLVGAPRLELGTSCSQSMCADFDLISPPEAGLFAFLRASECPETPSRQYGNDPLRVSLVRLVRTLDNARTVRL